MQISTRYGILAHSDITPHSLRSPLAHSLSSHSLARLSSSRRSPRSPLFFLSFFPTPQRHLPDSPSPASLAYLPVAATFLRVHSRHPFTYGVHSQPASIHAPHPRSKNEFFAPATSFWATEAMDLRAPALDLGEGGAGSALVGTGCRAEAERRIWRGAGATGGSGAAWSSSRIWYGVSSPCLLSYPFAGVVDVRVAVHRFG